MNILLPTVSGVAIAMALSGCVPAHREDCPVGAHLVPASGLCAVDERRGGDGGQRVTPDKPDDSGGHSNSNGGGSKSSDGNGGDSNGGSSDSNGDNSHE